MSRHISCRAACLWLVIIFDFAAGDAQTVDKTDYDHFRKLVEQNTSDSIKAASFAGAWLQEAKKDHNWKQMALAYKAILYNGASEPDRIRYADSMLVAAKNAKDDAMIGAAYLTKAIQYYDTDKPTAMDNYILADRHIARTSDKYSLYKIKYLIAETKFYLGYYDEAISLLNQCLQYYKEENERGYLNTLHGLSLCYNRLGDIEKSNRYNAEGLRMGRLVGNDAMEIFFRLSIAVNDHYLKRYAQSNETLAKLLPVFRARKDIPNRTVANFYMAQNHWEMGNYDSAVPYLKAVDTAFSEARFVRPELRRNYELLIDYNKKTGDEKQKDHYVDRLLRADRILDKNFAYLSKRVFKVYDTTKLLEERDEKNNGEKVRLYYLIGGISLALGIFVVWHIIVRRRIKRNFKKAMERRPELEKQAIEAAAKKTKNLLGAELSDTLLGKLAKWEDGKKFLEKNITATKMATAFHTNPKYISELVRLYRRKKFTRYVNDLRIDYIVELLKTQAKFRNYTNEALAVEGGFGSTQIFTRAFKTRVKLSPTTFIEELGSQDEKAVT